MIKSVSRLSVRRDIIRRLGTQDLGRAHGGGGGGGGISSIDGCTVETA